MSLCKARPVPYVGSSQGPEDDTSFYAKDLKLQNQWKNMSFQENVFTNMFLILFPTWLSFLKEALPFPSKWCGHIPPDAEMDISVNLIPLAFHSQTSGTNSLVPLESHHLFSIPTTLSRSLAPLPGLTLTVPNLALYCCTCPSPLDLHSYPSQSIPSKQGAPPYHSLASWGFTQGVHLLPGSSGLQSTDCMAASSFITSLHSPVAL